MESTREEIRREADIVQAVGISPAEGDKGGVTLITKKTKHPQRPGSSVNKVTFGGSKTTRKCVHLTEFIMQQMLIFYRTYKGIVSSTAKSGYRSDLRAEAVARASAIRLSQTPKKDAPEKKLRGSKAKKAAAEKDE
jgi:large subunit ribosomal protein L28e